MKHKDLKIGQRVTTHLMDINNVNINGVVFAIDKENGKFSIKLDSGLKIYDISERDLKN